MITSAYFLVWEEREHCVTKKVESHPAGALHCFLWQVPFLPSPSPNPVGGVLVLIIHFETSSLPSALHFEGHTLHLDFSFLSSNKFWKEAPQQSLVITPAADALGNSLTPNPGRLGTRARVGMPGLRGHARQICLGCGRSFLPATLAKKKKKRLTQDASPGLFLLEGASLSFLSNLCQLLQLISFLTATLHNQRASQPAGPRL